MEEAYKAIVNGTFEFDLDTGTIGELDTVSKSCTEKHVLHRGKSVTAEIISRDFLARTYVLKIGGNQYTVRLENELDALISEMGLSLGSSSVANEIHAPMPGLILEVNVSAGDTVSEGDSLCVLEAMKMENALSAPRNGVIKAVHIAEGETVDKNALLIEFED
ncbi:MAG: acetyl-CoA carboxylase biotin carboxyl carrier protein subunit [Flavobacteriaceae bacterium]|nr:acetyl-CoA carboxylase biotin carboxyl carrier protein subunit [Flavobacteriaceae bacterium]